MSSSQRGGVGRLNAPDNAGGGTAGGGGGDQPRSREGFGQQHFGGPGGGGKRRRRQRPQRGKRGGGGGPFGGGRPAHLEVANRERMFQELEGLLRQIREEAEESANWAEDEVNEIAQTVTNFSKYLEDQSDPISERVRSEYHRIREKLSQALKSNGRAG